MNMKKLLTVVTAISILGAAGAAFAATVRTPAEIAAALTGKTVTQVYQERAEGKTYGTIAKEAGKLTEFQQQVLEQKKALLDQRVQEGSLTQEQADQIYNRIKTNQTNCNGTGLGQGTCRGLGLGQGTGCGAGLGQGSCGGAGFGQGAGSGMGFGRGNGGGTGLFR